MKIQLTLTLMITVLLFASCGSGNNLNPDPQQPNRAVYVSFPAGGRIYAPAGTADAGTLVQIPTFNLTDTAGSDGGFKLDLPASATSRAGSTTLIPPLFSVFYIRNGDEVTEPFFEPDETQDSLVQHQLFSTGSGPNDMLLVNDSLYVANSLDNTVTRHNLSGELLATHEFNTGASPAFLGLHEDALAVSCNGNNLIALIDPLDLQQSIIVTRNYTHEFPGPGQPASFLGRIMLPMASIETFSPTVYADTYVSLLTYSTAVEPTMFEFSGDIQLPGKNAQFGISNTDQSVYYCVCSGEVLFDDNWTPYSGSDSWLSQFTDVSDSKDLNLGPVGAGRIAISDDETTAYLGNSLNGNLYKVDLENWTVLRGESNPIVLTTEFTYISDVAFTPDGKYLLATSFNTDELYVLDTATDTVNPDYYPAPFDLSLDPELLAGAANVEVVTGSDNSGGYSAFVLFGIANTVARIDLL